MKFLRLDWKDIEVLCYKLSKKIKKENFKPDLLVGLARGGLVPTRILSDILNIKNVAIIRTELY
ncbi:MAG: phosphoribosyltransferase family protein, partial [Candidatus Micrarchaeota archaeon]|nr:phosphoribosyltransferase family protein [Candidatus Micrarchaeota archaeon]